MESVMTYSELMETPIGLLHISSSEKGLTKIVFVEDDDKVEGTSSQQGTHKIITDCKQQLAEYFAGQRTVFNLPLDATGTDFQHAVWNALLAIPYGASASYSDIAQHIQNPKAVRAVGAANGKNPISIIVPCHRVIGRDGSLTGYAWGVERKQWLLAHEQPK